MIDFPATNNGLRDACKLRDALLDVPVRWNSTLDDYAASMREHVQAVAKVLRAENIRRQWGDE